MVIVYFPFPYHNGEPIEALKIIEEWQKHVLRSCPQSDKLHYEQSETALHILIVLHNHPQCNNPEPASVFIS
jgi:hypothetical protein